MKRPVLFFPCKTDYSSDIYIDAKDLEVDVQHLHNNYHIQK